MIKSIFKTVLVTFLILGTGIAGLGYLGYRYPPYEPIVKLVPVVDPNYVQNPYEAQERLKAQGLYDGKIDGLWGKKTDEAYCNWCGIQAMKRMEKSK